MDKKIRQVERDVKQGKPKKAIKDLKQLEKLDKVQDRKLKRAGIKPE